MLGIEREFSIFIGACFTGNIVCLSYCILRLFRRLFTHTLFWISFEDLLFWIFTALYIFKEMYHRCLGSIRWYFVLGVFLGGIVTGFLVQKIQKNIDKSRQTE